MKWKKYSVIIFAQKNEERGSDEVEMTYQQQFALVSEYRQVFDHCSISIGSSFEVSTFSSSSLQTFFMCLKLP